MMNSLGSNLIWGARMIPMGPKQVMAARAQFRHNLGNLLSADGNGT